MKKRTFVKIISFLLAILVVVSVLCIKYYKRSQSFKTEIRYTYSRSIEELNSSLNKISVALGKMPYVWNPAQLSQIATDIYTESKIAKQAFSQLPTGAASYENVNKFLSQVGNFTVYLAQKAIDGGVINDTEKSNIEKLTTMAEGLSAGFAEMQVQIDTSGYWSDAITNNIEQTLGDDMFADKLNMLEDSIVDYPTLLYDGPYSDYVSAEYSYLIENSEAVDEQTAKAVAANALGIPIDEIMLDNYDSGKIPAFNLVYGEGAATVSINGGYLISFRKYNVGEQAKLSYNAAKKKAEEFIGKIFGESFLANYYFTDNGVCVVNFALVEGGVICYTDLVKVGVDMSSGDVVFFDARGYITNNKPREIEKPEFTQDEAKAVLKADLSIKSSALCLIPTEGGYEKLCYEFLCKTKENREILVYIGAQTLLQEDIFLVFQTNGGTLTK
ncbi:MAG: germination protein YpeB [Clostridia bacterium]|nr:germination protein YpeB [Clostridia bacterium]